jgi:methionyl-tRNA formyltransferase
MRLVLMGTGTFAEPAFQALLSGPHEVACVVTQPPPRKMGNERGSTRQIGVGVPVLAMRAGVPVWRPESINTPESVAQLASYNADLLVVAAYGQILKPAALATAELGGINLHASLLPRHRGAAPVAWAILSGDTETGVSVLRMTPSLDAGDLVGVVKTPIGPDETAGELETRLAAMAAQIGVEVVDKLALGPVQGMPQDPALVTRAPKLKKEMGDLNWSLPAEKLALVVRAMQPWPTAYTHWVRPAEGKPPLRLLVGKTRAIAGEQHSAKPGDLLTPTADFSSLRVATGEWVLEILSVQPAGKAAMDAASFLRGRRFMVGDRLQKSGPADGGPK